MRAAALELLAALDAVEAADNAPVASVHEWAALAGAAHERVQRAREALRRALDEGQS